MEGFRDVRNAIFFVLSVITYGVSGFIIIEGWNFLDSLYMTIITASTVGYRETYDVSDLGRIHIIVLIILSLGTVAYAFSLIAQHMLNINEFRRRRMKKVVDKLKDHHLVAGYGRMGMHICRELSNADEDFVVIDNSDEALINLREDGYSYVQGDATEDSVLIAAGLERAKGLVVVLDTDADNVYCTLTAKGINQQIFIVARASSEKATAKLIKAGANKVINPYETGGQKMAHILLKPTVVEFFEFASRSGKNLELEINEISVDDKSNLVGKSLADSGIRKEYDVLIAAIKSDDGQIRFNPSPGDIINKGDVLVAFGELDNINRLEEAGINAR